MRYIIRIVKSFSSDLKEKFPDGKWITSNGSRIFIVPSKGGKNRVVAGLGGFNGIIDEKFREEKVSKEIKNNEVSKESLEKELKNVLKEWEKYSNKNQQPPIELQQKLTKLTKEIKLLESKQKSKPKLKEDKPKDVNSTDNELISKYKNLDKLIDYVEKYSEGEYNKEKTIQALKYNQEQGKSDDDIQKLIDFTLKESKQRYKYNEESIKAKEGASKEINKDNAFEIQRKLDNLKSTYQGMYGSETKEEREKLQDEYDNLKEYFDENYNKLIKQTLESDLPDKLPKSKEQLELPEGIGEIKVKPIEVKIKAKKPEDALTNNADNDSIRPTMNGIYRDAENQLLVASDGHQLVLVPAKIEGKSKNIGKDGSEIEGKYPDYMRVIPNNKNKIESIDISGLVNSTESIVRANRFVFGYKGGINVKLGDTDSYINPKILNTALKTLAETGTKQVNIEYTDDPSRAIIFRDANDSRKLALVMPVIADSSINYTKLDVGK